MQPISLHLTKFTSKHNHEFYILSILNKTDSTAKHYNTSDYWVIKQLKYSACYVWPNTYKNIEILEKQGSKKQCRCWNAIETYNFFFLKGQKKHLTHKFSFFLFWWVVWAKGRTWNIMKKPRSIGENIKLVFVKEVNLVEMKMAVNSKTTFSKTKKVIFSIFFIESPNLA